MCQLNIFTVFTPCNIKAPLLAILLMVVSGPTFSNEIDNLISVPSDWDLNDRACRVPNDQQNGADNSYATTSSKFLTWLNGTLEQAEFEPVGEIANYFGFAALRGEIRDRLGPQADEGFRGAVFLEILELLDDDQRDRLYELMDVQRPLVEGFLEARIDLIHALWGQQQGASINFTQVTDIMSSIGEYEALITVTGAQVYAQLMPTMSAAQLQYLADIRSGAIGVEDMRNSTLTHTAAAQAQFSALSNFDRDLMTTIASKVISWGTASLANAIYLPPGKISNYFGFANYRYVDRAQISRGGAATLVHDNLNAQQRLIMCDLSWAIENFTQAYVDGRAQLISELWGLHNNPTANINTNALVNDYVAVAAMGEGRRGTVEAMVYSYLESTLSQQQLDFFGVEREQIVLPPNNSNSSGFEYLPAIQQLLMDD